MMDYNIPPAFPLDPIFQNGGFSQHPLSQSIQPDELSQSSDPLSDSLIDNNYIGTPLPDDKPDNIFRLFFSNVNGITTGHGGNFHEYMEEMKRFSADAICLAEINLDTHNHAVKRYIFDTTRNIFNHSRLALASSATDFSSPIPPAYRPSPAMPFP
jgi:hypothetical protein